MGVVVETIEFSRTVEVAEIGEAGLTLTIVAGERERSLLARRFGLIKIKRFEAEVHLRRRSNDDNRIYLNAHFLADVTQNCVVSLVPIEGHIDDRFSIVFSSACAPEYECGSFSVGDPDPPEILTGDGLELGDLIAEHLALSLDSYPRHPGAAFPGAASTVEGEGTGAETRPLERSLKNLRKILHNGDS